MKKLKRILGAAVALALVLALAACGAAPSDDAAQGDTPKDNVVTDGQIEIELWVAGTEEDSHYRCYPAAIAKFEEENPDVKINLIPGGNVDDYSKKLTLLAETNDLPDLFLTGDAQIIGYAEAGVMTDITDYMEADEEWSSWEYMTGSYDKMLNYCNGRKYGIPMNGTAAGFFFNKTMFDEQGLEIPNTWDELLNAVKVFKEAGIVPMVHGASDLWSIWGFFPMFNQYGIAEIADDLKSGATTWSDSSMLEAYKRIQELAEAGAFPETTSSMTHAQAREAFIAGESPIITIGSWDATTIANGTEDEIDFRWSFQGMPNCDYNDNVGLKSMDWLIYTGASLAETDEKLEAGLRFLKFMCSPEASQILLNEGYSFTAYSCTDISAVEMDRVSKILYSALSDDAEAVGYSYDYVDSRLVDAARNTISSVITGTLTAEEAAQQMDDQMALLQ